MARTSRVNCHPEWTVQQRLDHLSIPERNSGCLLWIGSYGPYGYGIIGYAGRTWQADRLSWSNVNGPFPLGGLACHRCDVRGCINPDHLFLGTPRDNMVGMHEKRRRRIEGNDTVARPTQRVMRPARPPSALDHRLDRDRTDRLQELCKRVLQSGGASQAPQDGPLLEGIWAPAGAAKPTHSSAAIDRYRSIPMISLFPAAPSMSVCGLASGSAAPPGRDVEHRLFPRRRGAG
jgi:hypothetical protein